LYRRLGDSQGRSGQVRKISLPPGFDRRTVQPIASSYTDNATRPTYLGVDVRLIAEWVFQNWVGGTEWIDRDKWPALVNAVMSFRVA
jgi:hypothetical protein